MNKNDLAIAISNEAEITRKEATTALSVLTDQIKQSLQSGEPVAIKGLGTFKIVERAPRNGRNPRTGEMIAIPGKKIVKFVPSSDLNKSL